MTTAGQPTGYFNQTYAVEFTVEGPLDGDTLQPPLLDSPPAGVSPLDPQQLFRRTVPALGLIDPDYTVPEAEAGRRGARGNRLVTFLWIQGSVPGAPGASVDLVDAVDGTPLLQRSIASLAGESSFFRLGIFIPQGSMLRVSGLAGSAAAPIKVRLHIQFLNDAKNIAAVLEAQCCIEDGGGGEETELAVQQNGGLIALTSILNFLGNVNVADDPPNNRVNVEVLGGGAVQNQAFLDDATVDLVVGAANTLPPPGTITVDANISDVSGKSTAYRFTIGVSGTGAATDCMQVDAGTPILDIEYTALIIGTDVVLRLAGSGAGIQSVITYQVVRTLPRLLP